MAGGVEHQQGLERAAARVGAAIPTPLRVASGHVDAARSAAILGLSVPGFWLATLVIVLPAIWWGWTPHLGFTEFSKSPGAHVLQFILPALILGIASAAGIMRLTRALLPALDFTNAESVALIEPSAFTSLRKLLLVTTWPSCDLVCATSAAFTDLFPLVSAARKFTETAESGMTCAFVSVTLCNVTVRRWTSATPVRFTVIVLPEITGLPETVPTPEVTAALPLARLLLKVNTNVWFPPVSRHSTAGSPLNVRGTSNVPAPPCVLRETPLRTAT